MNWTSVRKVAAAALIPLVFGACESLTDITELEVINQNNPDASRAIATAGDVESLIGGSFYNVHLAMHRSNGMAYGVGADEFSVSWGNWAMRDFSSEPPCVNCTRDVGWNNQSSYGYGYVSNNPWTWAYRAISAVYDGIRAIDANPDFQASINTDRAEAYGKLVMGMAHGWIALSFDSGFVLDENVDFETDTLVMLPYPNVAARALGFLDEAIALADGKTWTTPTNWLTVSVTGTELAGWAHSWYAFIVANMARTPTEAQNLSIPGVCATGTECWAAVQTRAASGLAKAFATKDEMELLGDDFVWSSIIYYGANQMGSSWGRGDYKLIGYTELGDGGGMDNWMATPVQNRVEFELDIPDRRITPGPPPHTPTLSCGTYFCRWGSHNFSAARGTYHMSHYGHNRYDEWVLDNFGYGLFPIMHARTLKLYQAESLLWRGLAGAAAIVNETRVPAGLPAQTDGDPNLLSDLVYEQMIENYGAVSGASWFGKRRWGPLAGTNTFHWGHLTGTPLHFPLPGAELETLRKLGYTYGSPGLEGSALAASTESYCRGPGCGGGAAPVSFGQLGMSGGTAVPASHIGQIASRVDSEDMTRETRRSAAGRAARYN